MLGEDHSLAHEFPEHLPAIKNLTQGDKGFAKQARHYDDLDREIRKLELNNSPIEDDAMHAMKQERAELKDVLYQRLLSEQSH
ncbi:Uncharacterised protein [BD1-7 clade bacterium]|uniref:DUF465 domain-containing protein n=1 Tax=BD1-7 clade bacterium TaxID=2029982 RepID=A0A5S9PHR7_9GAMM|nr:Uncharacterised protein [BD1-7 clade bacterium]CAA0103575.1 Uncharacterised protein [BD1-7 clade bacterium]CAA0103630.1 Uncharacterised protein [BD1-7 clade bacterium]